ncbi:MAG: alpha/beta hydrolase [Candidatus Alcyoniella australis]|nr:alpha/beta hydrolase [Candidatus Alcyoniella australis]
MKAIKQNYVVGFDSCKIHYTAYGAGTSLVTTNGAGLSTSFWRPLVDYFKPKLQVVNWDLRGHGLSYFPERLRNITIPALAEDLLGVIDDVGADKCVLVGHHVGVQIVLELYRLWPERVAALVLVCGGPSKPNEQMFNWRYGRELMQATTFLGTNFPRGVELFTELLTSSPLAFPLIRRMFLDPLFARRKDFNEFLDHLLQIDFSIFFAITRAAMEHSAEDMLEEITVPTLVVGGEDDRLTPFKVVKKMAEQIPQAQLLKVWHGTAAALVEQPAVINLRIEKFLRDCNLLSKPC